MICPHCGNELQLPENVAVYCDRYVRCCVSVTECCGKAVHIEPYVSLRVDKYAGYRLEDNWGREIHHEDSTATK